MLPGDPIKSHDTLLKEQMTPDECSKKYSGQTVKVFSLDIEGEERGRGRQGKELI